MPIARGPTLVLLAFAAVFFPRIIETAGAPAVINFVHFAVIPLVCGAVLAANWPTVRERCPAIRTLLLGLVALFGAMAIGALVNGAGAINVLIAFMLLAEPFLLLVAVLGLPLYGARLQRFRIWLLGFAGINLLLAFGQKALMSLGLWVPTQMGEADSVQGVFYLSGGGSTVSVAVSMSFGLYYLVSEKIVPLWARVAVLLAAFIHLVLADAKQVLLVWGVAWLILLLSRRRPLKDTLRYAAATLVVGLLLLWSFSNVALFGAFETWAGRDFARLFGEAYSLKTGSLRLIADYYESPLHWLFGLGAGHTVGRLGGWVLHQYWHLLGPLGATAHPVYTYVWPMWRLQYLDSSLFSPLYGWAGIWGDFGFVGLGVYLFLGVIVWRQLCLDHFSKFLLLTVLVNGFVITLLEEPGYMLTIAVLIGLRWHEQQIQREPVFSSAQSGPSSHERFADM